MERAKLANWADISDVALLKRLREGEEWLRSLRMELLKENDGLLAKQTALPQHGLWTARLSKNQADRQPVADSVQLAVAESGM